MKKKNIALIIGLMTLALLGVLGMQWYFLRQSYQLKSQLFDQNVNEALSNVAKKLEKQEAYNFLVKKAVRGGVSPSSKEKGMNKGSKTTLKQQDSYASYLKKEQLKADSLFAVRDSLLRARYAFVLTYDGVKPDEEEEVQEEIVQFVDPFGGIHQQKVQKRVPKKKLSADSHDSVRQYIVFDPQSGPRLVTLAKPKLNKISQPETSKQKTAELGMVKNFLDSVQENKKNVIQDLAREFGSANLPLNKRIQPQVLEALLQQELKNKGISGAFSYQVQQAKNGSFLFKNIAFKDSLEASQVYKTRLFPKEMIQESGWLLLRFPNKAQFILSNMTWIMLLSGGLLLILLGSFAYILQLILKQKKVSEMKTDFINNMTHEFKTPVATIMIASEALRDEEITQDKDRIKRLAGIIYDENVRLGNHIERVLHLAKVDKEDFKLENRAVEINTLLTAVADSMSLQFQKHKATMSLHLHAQKEVVLADELHLSNVVFNLLDNALKYCEQEPNIEITSHNQGNDVVITVKDNGIGMSREQVHKIFDQFYRIPTGNVHNVKGFGLGLSYVNTIVRLLKGHIRVKSEKNKGSSFEISIPLA